ncbi:MAG: hypothetical protein AAFN59_00485, partial [Pseudomonadota bacterium]
PTPLPCRGGGLGVGGGGEGGGACRDPCHGAREQTPSASAARPRGTARRIPVVAISETLFGGTRLGTYAAGAALVRHGVIDGRDMTLEAAYAKLHLALASVEGLPAIRQFIETPLAGEFTVGQLGA